MNEVEKKSSWFTNYGDPPFGEREKDGAVAELRLAGFPRGSESITMVERELLKEGTEAHELAKRGVLVPPQNVGLEKHITEWKWLYSVKAKRFGWTFSRAWRYWVVEAECDRVGVPVEDAEKLNEEYYEHARVDGYAGGRDPRETVTTYHVDSQAGLNALVQLLEMLEQKREEEAKARWEEHKKKLRNK